jgi:hypothetical protein
MGFADTEQADRYGNGIAESLLLTVRRILDLDPITRRRIVVVGTICFLRHDALKV